MPKKQAITLAKLETIAETTNVPEVRILAQTMSKYIKDHEKDHRIEVTQELGFIPPVVPEVEP